MGESTIIGDAEPIFVIKKRNGEAVDISDGAVTKDGKCWGTYIHGIFDNDGFRRNFLNGIRRDKGLDLIDKTVIKDNGFDRLADVLKEHLDMDQILELIDN